MRTLVMLTASAAAGLLALAGCGQQDAPAADAAAGRAAETPAEVASAAPEADLPEMLGRNLKVKPGLWEADVNTDGDIVRSQYCVGEGGIPLSQDAGYENPECQPRITTRPGGVTMTADCVQSGVGVKMKLDYRTSQTRADGDMNLTVSAPDGQARTMTSRMTSRWVSAGCPADLAPGDSRTLGEDDDE